MINHTGYKAAAVLAGAMFFRMFGVFVALPVAAVFAASLPGGDVAWLAGLAVGGYGISQAIMQMPAGKLADVFGRKLVMCVMLLIFATGGFVAAAADDVWQLAAGRILQGGGAVAAIGAAWIADVTTDAQRSRAMMGYGGAIALAFAVSLLSAAPLGDALGFKGLFQLTGWLGIISAVAVSLLPAPEKSPLAAAKKSESESPTSKMPAVNSAVARYALIAFVSHYALSALFFHAPLQLSRALPLGEHWHVYMPAFLCALPPSLWLVFREKHFSPRLPVVVIALFLTALGIIGVLLVEKNSIAGAWEINDIKFLWLQGTAMFVFFAGFIALEALIPSHTSRLAPTEKRATALGFVMSMEFLGMFCGAITTAALSTIGVLAPVAAAFLLFSLAFVIIHYAIRR